MDSHRLPIPLEKAYRLINHGPTVLVSASHQGVNNVMAAAWACGLDYSPSKVTVVLSRESKTRELVEKSGYFALQVPTVLQARLTYAVGSCSLSDEPDKLKRCGVELFYQEGHATPLVAGCSAWLVCRLISEPHNQETYDLFIGEVVGAWADGRVFREGRWHFETADPSWRSLHHIAGGQFYITGDPVRGTGTEPA